jgi:hypothetical protein
MATTTREPRAEEERTQRRRRDEGTLDRMNRLTLHIPEEVEARYPNHKFRWTNDEGNRMYAKTQLDDWDKVDDVPPIPVGTDPAGKPIYAHLCKKLKSFCEEDMQKREAELKEMERGLIRGERDESTKADLPDDRSYVPEGRNTINRGIRRG